MLKAVVTCRVMQRGRYIYAYWIFNPSDYMDTRKAVSKAYVWVGLVYVMVCLNAHCIYCTTFSRLQFPHALHIAIIMRWQTNRPMTSQTHRVMHKDTNGSIQLHRVIWGQKYSDFIFWRLSLMPNQTFFHFYYHYSIYLAQLGRVICSFAMTNN